MKKTRLFGLFVLLLTITVTSCSKQTELSKMISPNRVIINGENANLFVIEDSVKVRLVPVGVDGDKWEVRTSLPLKNTIAWSEIPGSDSKRDHFISGVIIYAKYVDKNDSELDLSVETDYQSGEKLLKSEELITGDIPIVEYSFGNKSYKYQKNYYDHIDGVVLDIRLSWSHAANSSSSKTSSSSYSNGNWNVLLNDFENYVTECVKLIKKQDRGESVSDKKIDDLLDKIDELEKKLDKGLEKMSEAQFERYMKLVDEINDAIL